MREGFTSIWKGKIRKHEAFNNASDRHIYVALCGRENECTGIKGEGNEWKWKFYIVRKSLKKDFEIWLWSWKVVRISINKLGKGIFV